MRARDLGHGQPASLRTRRDPHDVRGLEAELADPRSGKRQLDVALAVDGGRPRDVQPELDVLLLELGRRARRVDAEVHLLVVVAVIDALDETGGSVQRAKTRSHQVVAALRPRRVMARHRADRGRRHTALRCRRALDDRLEQARGRTRAHQLVHVAQVQAELVVPDRVHARVVLAAEPPEPVAALGD